MQRLYRRRTRAALRAGILQWKVPEDWQRFVAGEQTEGRSNHSVLEGRIVGPPEWMAHRERHQEGAGRIHFPGNFPKE